jgi:hypothetical protein
MYMYLSYNHIFFSVFRIWIRMDLHQVCLIIDLKNECGPKTLIVPPTFQNDHPPPTIRTYLYLKHPSSLYFCPQFYCAILN